jgi:hypothetical protein
MGIDNNTTPSYVNIVLPHSKEIIGLLKQQAEKDGQEEGMLAIREQTGTIETSEYYYDNKENEIYYCGTISTVNGDIFITISLPISDILVVDIIQMVIKKLNKLKSVIESLF